MKRIFSCFLFQARPGDGLTAGKRRVFWLWNWGLLILAALAVGLFSLILAPGSFGSELFWDYLAHPGLVALNLAPPVLLTVLLYGLTGRAWLACLITAVPVLALSVGNFYKLAFRNDPVVASDLLLLGEAGNMAGNYQLFLFDGLITALAGTALCVVLLALFARGRPKGRARAVVSGVALVCAAALTPVYASDAVYKANANNEHVNQWFATDQYVSRGLLYPFLYSVKEAIPSPPEGYDQREAAALLANYEDADIPEDKKVNVMAIMLEAFNDFTKFDVPGLNTDRVYEVWHALEEEGYSGDLVTNIFAGGTVDTERAFLTGFDELPSFRGPTNSYAWYFRSQGYTVGGMHPGYQWFYDRKNINEYLGFEYYLFVENYFATLTDGWIAVDPIFIPELQLMYQVETEKDKPYFSFSVSYQGHGPYPDDECERNELGFCVDNSDGRYTQEEHYIMENYFSSLYSTQMCLKDLTDYLRDDDEPVVLVLFGDHNPWMGDGNSVYDAMGIDFDLSTKEGLKDYYATRYIIWANDAAKEVLGNDFQGEGPEISPCFLMNQVFELCGWTGPAYLQAIQEAADQVPIQNVPTGRSFAAGSDTGELTAGEEQIAARYKQLEYYYQRNFRYKGLELDYQWGES